MTPDNFPEFYDEQGIYIYISNSSLIRTQMCSDVRELLLREVFKNVPIIFSGDNVLTPPQDDLLSLFTDKLLLIFSKGIPIDELYQDLRDNGPNTTVCAQVFNKGDDYYTCLECRVDQKRVLCKDCLFSSPHRYHNYKMSLSPVRGGCCDCGDIGSWNKYPHCDKHKPETQTSTQSDPLIFIPDWLAVHGHEFFLFIFEYALVFLNYKGWDSLPPDYKLEMESYINPNPLCLLGVRVETNQLSDVINLFTEQLKISNKESLSLYYGIQKLGRSLLIKGSENECSELAASLHQLQTKVLPLIIAQHQECSLFLLKLLLDISTETTGLQKICAMTFFCTDFASSNGESIMELLFTIFPDLWISVCDVWREIIIRVVIPQEDTMIVLAELYIENYQNSIINYLENIDNDQCSLHFMSVHLFVRSSTSLYLIESSNALLKIIATLESCMSMGGTVMFPIRSSVIKTSRIHYLDQVIIISNDLSCILRHTPSNKVLTEPLIRAFLEGMKAYLNVLMLFEYTDAVKREIRDHVPIEVEWRGIFIIQSLLQPVTTIFIEWLSQNKVLLLQSVNQVIEVLKHSHPPINMKIDENTIFNDYTCKIPTGTVSTDAVSCHIPLTRFLSGLLSMCHFKEINIKIDTILRDDVTMQWVLERCIRPLVLKSQVLNKMWVRNGPSVTQMIRNYHSYMCNEMYYRDIYLLQLLAAHMPPEYVLLNFIKKFEVAPWFESFKAGSLTDMSDRNFFLPSMCEEMLETLITIIVERNNVNLAEVTPDQVMEQSLISNLFLQDWSHSNLLEAIKRGNFAFDYSIQHSLDTWLPKLTNDSFVSGKRLFSLKPEFYDRVSLFYYHDSKENQFLFNNQLKIISQGNNRILSTLLTPPIIPKFRQHLCSILEIFNEIIFIQMLYTILDRTINNSELVSDYMTHEALFLISIGLLEEKRGTICGFIESLKGKSTLHPSNNDFSPILAELSTIPSCEDIRPLINWINLEIFSKNEIDKISEKIVLQQETEKKMVDRREIRQNLAITEIQKQQVSFLQMLDEFDQKDDIDDEINENKVEGYNITSHPIRGIGVQCLSSFPEQKYISCIFCQESTLIHFLTESGKFWVLPGYCTPYFGLRKGKSSIKSLFDTDAVLTPATLDFGIITESCGHSFHFTCWEQFMSSASPSHNRLVISSEEYKCPLCSSTCNTIFPLSPILRYSAVIPESKDPPSFNQFLKFLNLINNDSKFHSEDAIKLATAFCSCFQIQENNSSSISFFKDNQNAFKLSSKCIEVGFEGADQKDPALTVLALNNTVNYTIQAKNNELAALGKVISNELNAHQQLVLRSIVHTAVVTRNVESHQVCCQNANKILDTLLVSGSKFNSNIFDYDAFSLLVNLQLSLPHLIAEVKNPISDLDLSLALLPTVSIYVFKLTLYYRLVQILLYINLSTVSSDYESDGVNRDSLVKLWSLRKRTLPEQLRRNDISMKTLHSELIRLLLPFLRTASMFYNLLFNLPFPTQLIDWKEQSDSLTQHEELDVLLSHVGCPGLMSSINEIFSCSASQDLIRDWFSVGSNSSLLYAQHVQHPSQIVFPYGGLVALPDKYTDILAEASEYNCPITRVRAEEVVKCLVCGNCVCITCLACTETYKETATSDQPIGPYTEHIIKCSNGIGVGIWVKNACIVLLSVASGVSSGEINTIGMIRGIPYLDRFGEEDIQLMNGMPLFLSSQLYKEINDIWIQNNIPRTIDRTNEDKPEYQNREWQTF